MRTGDLLLLEGSERVFIDGIILKVVRGCLTEEGRGGLVLSQKGLRPSAVQIFKHGIEEACWETWIPSSTSAWVVVCRVERSVNQKH